MVNAMRGVIRSTRVPQMTAMTDEAQAKSRQLFFMFAVSARDAALSMVRQVEASGGVGNGLEAWSPQGGVYT